MAKYSRFDSRNQKKGKHKKESLNKSLHKIKDLNIEQNNNSSKLIREVMYDDEEIVNDKALQS